MDNIGKTFKGLPLEEDASADVAAESADTQVAPEPVDPTAAQAAPEPVDPTAVQAAPEPVDPADAQVAPEPVDPTAAQAAPEPVDPTAVQAAPEPAEVPPAPEAVPAAPAPKKAKPWMLAIGILAAIGIIAGIAFAIFESKRAEAYEQAMAYYNAGQYTEAAEAFEELGDYEDSETWHEKATLWLRAQAAEARAGEDPAAWESAASIYRSIGDSRATTAATNCLDAASYYTAKGLMAEEKWTEAGELLSDLADKGYQDAGDLRTECAVHVTYEEAEALYAEGRYYDAYVTYNSISEASYEDLPDMGEKAQSCIQSFPETGVVYRNGDYPDQNCELSIDNSGHSNAYYKLYMGDTLILTVFIPEDGYATFMLPAGTYRMNKGYGTMWFGTDDMFGDEGSYWRCNFGGSEEFTLEAWSGYEITSGGGGTPISTDSSDRGSI